MTDPKDNSPISPTVVVSVTDTNGGVYEIRYQRPGPVAQHDVEHDLWCLGEALAQREAEIHEASNGAPSEQTVVVGELTVSAMDRAGVAAMFGDDTSEQQRIMVSGPQSMHLHLAHYGGGVWSIDHGKGDGNGVAKLILC